MRHQLRGSRIDLINIKVYEERCIKIQEKNLFKTNHKLLYKTLNNNQQQGNKTTNQMKTREPSSNLYYKKYTTLKMQLNEMI